MTGPTTALHTPLASAFSSFGSPQISFPHSDRRILTISEHLLPPSESSSVPHHHRQNRNKRKYGREAKNYYPHHRYTHYTRLDRARAQNLGKVIWSTFTFPTSLRDVSAEERSFRCLHYLSDQLLLLPTYFWAFSWVISAFCLYLTTRPYLSCNPLLEACACHGKTHRSFPRLMKEREMLRHEYFSSLDFCTY